MKSRRMCKLHLLYKNSSSSNKLPAAKAFFKDIIQETVASTSLSDIFGSLTGSGQEKNAALYDKINALMFNAIDTRRDSEIESEPLRAVICRKPKFE